MKKTTFIFIFIGILYSCNTDDDLNVTTELTGNWKLTEILNDPGDGSGTFTAVESGKIITFQKEGIITSNGSICDMSITSNNPTSGTYSDTDLNFISNDCGSPNYEYTFEQDGDILIINYPCFEACRAKYSKQ